MKLWAVLLVVAAIAVAAVAGTRAYHSGGPSKSEAAWVEDWGVWHNDALGVLARAEEAELGRPAVFRATFPALRSCAHFDSRVPAAPARYRPARQAAERACTVIRSAATLGDRLLAGDDPASVAFGDAIQQGTTLLEEASEALRVRLSFNRRLPVLGGAAQVSRVEPRLSRVASAIAGRPTDARCWSPSDWNTVVREEHAFYGERSGVDLAGFAQPGVTGRSVIHLAPEICAGLGGLLYGKAPVRIDLAEDVLVLTHEAEHITSPPSSEFVTECYAVQHMARAGRLLGLPAARSQELASAYWRYLYPDDPPGYKSPACGPGRPLDETPGDGVWP